MLQGHLCYLRKRNGKQLPKQEWLISYNTHPDQRLISDAEATEIESILNHNRVVKGFGSTALKYPLSGLVYCETCRSACYSVSGNRGKTPGYNYYFQCKNWRTRSCTNKKMVRMEPLEESVIEALTNRARAIATQANQPQTQDEPLELKELRNQLAGLEQLGYNPAIESAKVQLRAEIQNGERSLHLGTTYDEGNRELLQSVFLDAQFWQQLPPEKRRRVYRQLVERLVIGDGQLVEVILKI